MQNPFVLIIFALIFVALAFSMFGYYEIQLPQSLQTKLSSKSNEAGDRGGLLGVAIMGFLSALIVGPCVAPALAGALVYIGQSGDALLGGLALFVMSLGMGMPLLLVGAGAGKFMPKPGGWMTKVSQIFGVVMLGLAIWMIDRIIPPTITMYLWAGLLVGSGAIFFKNTKNSIGKLISIVVFALGVLLLFGAIKGATNPLKPLEFSHKSELNFHTIKSEKELDSIILSSKKPVLVDFTAKWCVSCKEFEEITFRDKKVIDLMKNFKLLRVDITKNTPEDKKLLKRFELVGPPAIIFFKNGKELKNKKVVGYKEPKVFAPILEGIK
jgi:thiol:disulfide interchange protein DsbD